MPAGTEPIISSQVIENKTVKTYYRLTASAAWQIDDSLICTGINGTTNGVSIGQASFFVLESSNGDGVGYQEQLNARVYNASIKYRTNFNSGYQGPYYVKVTTATNGEEEQPIFYGYIHSVQSDFTGQRATCTALSYAGLLDQQQMYGGWYEQRDGGGLKYYPDYKPVYNPNGIGNRGTSTFTPTGSTHQTYGIDNSKLENINGDVNKFTVLDMINTVWTRTSGSIPGITNPHKVFTNLYNKTIGGNIAGLAFTEEALAKILPGGSDTTFAPDNYTLQGKSIWEALVELVESIDGLGISEDIDTAGINSSPFVKIADIG
jgi:hypothetical protein